MRRPKGVKRDRSAWLRGRDDAVAAQANAGKQSALWDLARQLAGKKAARGPKPLTVLRAGDGCIISDSESLVKRLEDLFVAEF